MPRSKRSKVVSLTKTASKGRDLKARLVQDLRGALDAHKAVYAFSFENMRAAAFKHVRMDWRESRIFMGKNKIAQIALGRTPEEEYKESLHNISDLLEGNVGLLFTNRSRKDVIKYFSHFTRPEFAKAGTVPTESIALDPGPLNFPVTMMDELRKLGLIVEAGDGHVVLRTSASIATAGAPLTPEQARLLMKLDKRIIDFKIQLLGEWRNDNFSLLR